MQKEDKEINVEELDEKQESIMLLCRAVSRLFISKLIKEKLSNKKNTEDS